MPQLLNVEEEKEDAVNKNLSYVQEIELNNTSISLENVEREKVLYCTLECVRSPLRLRLFFFVVSVFAFRRRS